MKSISIFASMWVLKEIFFVLLKMILIEKIISVCFSANFFNWKIHWFLHSSLGNSLKEQHESMGFNIKEKTIHFLRLKSNPKEKRIILKDKLKNNKIQIRWFYILKKPKGISQRYKYYNLIMDTKKFWWEKRFFPSFYHLL